MTGANSRLGMIQQQLTFVRNVLSTKSQRPDGQLGKGKFRGDAAELTGLQALDDFAGVILNAAIRARACRSSIIRCVRRCTSRAFWQTRSRTQIQFDTAARTAGAAAGAWSETGVGMALEWPPFRPPRRSGVCRRLSGNRGLRRRGIIGLKVDKRLVRAEGDDRDALQRRLAARTKQCRG